MSTNSHRKPWFPASKEPLGWLDRQLQTRSENKVQLDRSSRREATRGAETRRRTSNTSLFISVVPDGHSVGDEGVGVEVGEKLNGRKHEVASEGRRQDASSSFDDDEGRTELSVVADLGRGSEFEGQIESGHQSIVAEREWGKLRERVGERSRRGRRRRTDCHDSKRTLPGPCNQGSSTRSFRSCSRERRWIQWLK